MHSRRVPPKLGSDGKSTQDSLPSDEEAEDPENHEEDYDIVENALRNPQNVKWKLPPRKVVITRNAHSKFGIEYGTKSIGQRNGKPKVRYLWISDVKPGSPAASTPLRRGDLVLSVNDEPIFCEEDSRAKKEFGSRIAQIFREADTKVTLRLYVQSPGGIAPNVGTHPMVILVLPHLKNIVRVCPNFALSKLPYSKIIIIGEGSAAVTARIFKRGTCTPAQPQMYQTFARLIRRTEQMGRHPVFRLDPTRSSYKTWMWSDVSLKQFVDEANGRHPPKQYHHVDVITLSHERGILNGAIASSCMGGCDVLLYQIEADRLNEESDSCLKELVSIAGRLHAIVGHSVPVIVAVTTKVSCTGEKHRESLKRIIGQVPQDHCSIVHVVFLDPQQDTDRYHTSAPVESIMKQPEQRHRNNCYPTADIVTKVLGIVWEQEFRQTYPAKFLIHLELFWQMVHRQPQRGFVKGMIQDACQIEDNKELSDFIAFLKMIGEILIVRPGSVHELIVQPSYVLPFLRKLLTPPSPDQQSTTLRAHWKMLTSFGVVTSAFLEELFGSADMSTVVSALQELKMLLPMSPFAAGTNIDIRQLPSEKSEFFIVKHALGASTDCPCREREYNSRLRVKFESRIPLDFMERLALNIVENSKDKDPRWKAAGPCGCFEFIRRDGCAASFQRDPLSSSVSIFPSLSGNYRPVDLLRLIRESVRDMEISTQGQPAVGCDCPICEVEGRVHVLDVDPDVPDSFVHCGVQRLDDHPRVTFWSPGTHKSSSKNMGRETPSSDPDDLSNLNDDIYSSLCRRLNVLDPTSRLDWRMLAAKLSFSNEDITQLHKPLCPEWDSCDRLLKRWRSTGQASFTRLMALLIIINRRDVASDLLTDCRRSQPELLDRISRNKPGVVQRIVEQLNL